MKWEASSDTHYRENSICIIKSVPSHTDDKRLLYAERRVEGPGLHVVSLESCALESFNNPTDTITCLDEEKEDDRDHQGNIMIFRMCHFVFGMRRNITGLEVTWFSEQDENPYDRERDAAEDYISDDDNYS